MMPMIQKVHYPINTMVITYLLVQLARLYSTAYHVCEKLVEELTGRIERQKCKINKFIE